VRDDCGEALVMNSVNIVATTTDTHRTERARLRGLDYAVNVFTFGDCFNSGLFCSTHFVFRISAELRDPSGARRDGIKTTPGIIMGLS
jgi:hypothetical protein